MSVATLDVTSDGNRIDPTYEVVSLAVTKEVNRIPAAEIRLIDGDMANQDFPISDGDFFAPGKTIEILLRYEGQTEYTVFTGVVVRQSVENGRRNTILTVECKDPAIAMTTVRRSAVFAEKTDAQIIGDITTEAGLSKGSMPATSPTHPEIVQFRCTDWDFIVSRADVNGLLVVASGGEISLNPIAVSGAPKHQFEFGLTRLYDFEIELDGASQVEGVESAGWDPAAQSMTDATVATAPDFATGNRDGGKIAGQLGSGTYTLKSPVSMDPAELQAWADSRLARNRMALLRGRISIPGQGDVELLDVIEVLGVGSRFSGTTVITGLIHRLSSRGWTTDVQFGLSADGFSSSSGIEEAPAAGLLPAVSGLHVGIVEAFEEDPAGELRVRVRLPGVEAGDDPLWARLGAADAGTDRGWFFRPDVGDEVVLGFLNDDPRRPVILGSLFSSAQLPPDDLPIDEDNFVKGVVTRSGTKLIFNDAEKPSITIETPGANSIVLDDDAEEIRVTDQHGNTITLSKDGVAISSAKDFEISASGDVKITADGNVEIKGSKVDVK